MKNGFHVFLATFVALGASWCGLVLGPVLQLGTQQQATVLNGSDLYPIQRPGNAIAGLQVYRASGCAACHTEQVRQEGVVRAVSLTSIGKNHPADFKDFMASLLALPDLQSQSNTAAAQLEKWNGALPQTLVTGLDVETANDLIQRLNAGGCKAEVDILATGADITRGWGVRQSVAADYLYDDPVQLGSLRAGPDLSNIGVREPNLNWQLVHLYDPQAETANSTMPPFRYLFKVQKIGDAPSPDALNLPKAFAPPAGYEVVPSSAAKNLAAYLLSLRENVPLYEAPFTPMTAKP